MGGGAGAGAAGGGAFGTDRYVFYTRTSGKVDRFDPDPNPEYRFLADLDACTDGWRWTAFAIIEADDDAKLREIANRIIVPPDPVDETTKPSRAGTRAMRRTKHFPFFGFARLQVAPADVDKVLEAIDSQEGYSGSASVAQGRFTIIVELGADDPDEVCRRLVALGVLPGVRNVEAARVGGSHYYYRRPNEQRGKKYRVGVPEDEA